MAEEAKNQIDAFTDKYTEGFDKFSKSKSGNFVLDFILFKRNLVPYTLQILFVLGVLGTWIIAIMGFCGQGPIGDYCYVTARGSDEGFKCFLKSLGIGLAVMACSPFIIHYALELVKVLWKFVVHVYEKVLVPIWNTLVLRFLANVAPQVLPFLYERCMKAIDIVMCRLDPFLDVMIGLIVSISMTLIAVVKGSVWLPKSICQRIGRWLDKSSDGDEVDSKGK